MKTSSLPVLAVAAAFALTIVPPANASFRGANGRIALERLEAGNPRGTAVTTVRANGGEPVRAGDGSFPSWSASGRWLAYSTGDVTISKADGSGARIVVIDGYGPSWAPGGRALVFVRDLDDAGSAGFPTLFRVNVDGTGLKQLVQGTSPSWSPNGKLIAYASGDSLWAVQADGKRRVRIWRGAPYLVDVDWAPNGRSLLVVRQIGGRDRREIVRVSTSGRRVGTVLRAKGITGAAWSPDATSVVYSRGTSDESTQRVYTVPAGGGKSTLVGQGSRPSWQPLR